MTFIPQFKISSELLQQVETIAALRQRISSAAVDLAWIPALQKDSRSRNVHASTAIEGNPLTLEQVRGLEEGRALVGSSERSQREVLNCFAGLRFIEKNARIERVRHDDLFELHRILADEVMDQGEAGRYRTIHVRVGQHFPPHPGDVSSLVMELLDWWNDEAPKLSPILSSSILHYRFEDIHPFADGNGRTGRALALWELYRRGFDTHHIFSVDEYYWEDRARYYGALAEVSASGGDLSKWLEYCAEGLLQSLERAWLRIQTIEVSGSDKLLIKPNQERLLLLLRDHGEMAPREIWEALGLSRQGAMNAINPLIDAGIIKKVGSKKTGRYRLVNRTG